MKNKGLWIFLSVIVFIFLFFIGIYNGLINSRENIKSAWSQVENVMQRRAELIPNLVATVKGYAKHEKMVLIETAAARYKNASSPVEKMKAMDNMNAAIRGLNLNVIVENYPNLKANENFIRLQDELAGTENRIAVERKRYIDSVVKYNKQIKRVPGLWFARMFGFSEEQYFEATAGSEKAPVVNFNE